MDRASVIAKIKAMLKLQASTDFDGEAAAAAALIDKLCNQYDVTIQDATEVQVLDECFMRFKRINHAVFTLLTAVASFYDAKAYSRKGDEDSGFYIVGSEGQQIQTKLYFEYLKEVMERECAKAHKAEKVIADLTGGSVSRSFKGNFYKSFASQVSTRLQDMKKEEGRVHQDALAVKGKLSTMRFRSVRSTGASGDGAAAGGMVGADVSLRRQAGGAKQKALCGV